MSTKQQAVEGEQPRNQGSIMSGMIWMLLLSALLFWLPAFGQLIAGYVGGKKAGGVMSGLIAGVLPAVIIGGVILTASTSMNLPVIGALLGGAASLIIIAYSITILIGALIGGALA